jgi:hypothetical protein
MSDCCDTVPRPHQASRQSKNCPHCHSKGKAVVLETVKAMLAISLEAVQVTSYHFCATATCPVVYFAMDSQQVFLETELRERVHQKAPLADDVFVCYCFRYTPQSLRAEIAALGHSTAVQAIHVGIQSGRCACEIRNPQGSCCLGNVKAVLHQIVDATLTHTKPMR